MNQKTTILVVFGTGSDGKPHASRFEASDEALVRKAAGLMGFKFGRAETEQAHALAKKLPEGKLFQAGRALVPYVKQDLFDQIKALVTVEPVPSASNPTAAAATGSSTANGKKNGSAVHDDPWAAIKIGDVVLCHDQTASDPSWWESVVVAVAKDGETLTVRWRDYPKLKQFTVKRRAVGLLPVAPRK